jgi:hypothetical protein
VLAAHLDEFLKRLMVIRLTGVTVGQALQQPLSVLFLVDRIVGDHVSIFERIAYGGPEELLLDGLMLQLDVTIRAIALPAGVTLLSCSTTCSAVTATAKH